MKRFRNARTYIKQRDYRAGLCFCCKSRVCSSIAIGGATALELVDLGTEAAACFSLEADEALASSPGHGVKDASETCLILPSHYEGFLDRMKKFP